MGVASKYAAPPALRAILPDRVVSYEAKSSISAESAVFMDIAGDCAVRSATHRHLGNALIDLLKRRAA